MSRQKDKAIIKTRF